MPVASHTLSFPVNVTNALSGAQSITAIQVTLNTDSEADAIANVLLALGGASAVVNPQTVNTNTVTYG
jgi:hypothetical protein